MTQQQLSVLNALVTHAVEHLDNNNLPVSDDEREVAQIVGGWALQGKIEVEKTGRDRIYYVGDDE